MSDVFISYASRDREKAKRIAELFRGIGWSVWWDRTIPPGKQFDEAIEDALDAAKCAVVLWSSASVASSWVKTEAAEAMRRKVLVPILIEPAKIPLEFRRLQAADLTRLRDDRSEQDPDTRVQLEALIQSVRALVGNPAAPADEPSQSAVPHVGSARAPDPAPAVRENSAAPPAAPAPSSQVRDDVVDVDVHHDVARSSKGAGRRLTFAVGIAGLSALAAIGLWRFTAERPVASLGAETTAASPDAAVSAVARSPSSLDLGSAMAPDAVRQATAEWRTKLSRQAEGGAVQAQYDLAVSFECGQEKNLNEAKRLYKAASTQGHDAARERLIALEKPLPEDARDREHETIRREINCLSELQKASSKTLDEMNENARKAVSHIKPG